MKTLFILLLGSLSSYASEPQFILSEPDPAAINQNFENLSDTAHKNQKNTFKETNTFEQGVSFKTSSATVTQADSGMHLVSHVAITANSQTYDFTGLDSLSDGGYLLDFAIKNNAGAAVAYTVSVGTFTSSALYNGDRFIVDASTITSISEVDNQVAVTQGSGQNTTGKVEIKHINDEVFAFAKSRDGVLTGRRTVTVDFTLQEPAPLSFTTIRISASAANGLGIGTTFKLYTQR